MNVTDLTSAASVSSTSQMDSVSGASGYVPAAVATTTDPLLEQMRSDIKQNSQDFKALKQALNANNPAAAVQAFVTVQQDIQKTSQANGGKSPFDPNSPIGKDFQAVGDALKSGDLAAAKQAFATFKHDIKAAGRTARVQLHRADNDGDADDGGQGSDSSASSAIGNVGSVTNTSGLDVQA